MFRMQISKRHVFRHTTVNINSMFRLLFYRYFRWYIVHNGILFSITIYFFSLYYFSMIFLANVFVISKENRPYVFNSQIGRLKLSTPDYVTCYVKCSVKCYK